MELNPKLILILFAGKIPSVAQKFTLLFVFCLALHFGNGQEVAATAPRQTPVISRLIGNDRLGKRDSVANWTLHFQLTGVMQGHPAFHANYSGLNSLQSNADNGDFTITSTIFLGRKLWKGAAIYANPEVSGGQGMSLTRGIAGFTNGEAYRVGTSYPTFYIARIFIQQNIALKNSDYDFQPSDKNQLGGKIPTSRVTITAGKISMADYFDDNAFSHDPRTQFLNWSLMENGAWDYPANVRGYTPGVVVEVIKPWWAIRFATALMPALANSNDMDWQWYKSNSETAEFTKRWKIKKRLGAVHLLGYLSFTKAPTYQQAINEMKDGDSSLVAVIQGFVESNINGGKKYGFGINADQEITEDIGVFARVGWNDGHTATWAFAEIDQTASLGGNVTGRLWKRPMDNIGLAGVLNGISKWHRAYLQDGGYGFMIGDGTLSYAPEGIVEVFYQAQLASFLWATVDYQFVADPAYNTARGPVHVLGARVHVEF